MYGFLRDLDDYFCEKYANYDKICVLKGYSMPVMHETVVERGVKRARSLPKSVMALSHQANKEDLLAQLKKQTLDTTFSFSFHPQNIFQRIGDIFSKRSVHKLLKAVLRRYNVSMEDAGARLDIPQEVGKGICKGKFLPTKNLIFTIALTFYLSLQDTQTILGRLGVGFDAKQAKDVVVSYLLAQKIYNAEMVKAALDEYQIRGLFLKS